MTRLIVAPHFDDADLGASMLARDARLVVVAGKRGEPRHGEQLRSTAFLQATLVGVGGRRDGYVEHDRGLVQFIEEHIDPDFVDCVLSPPVLDTHQDHSAVAAAVVSAARRSPVGLIEYETPSAMPTWVPNFWVPMNHEDIQRQCSALACHGSQKGRPYMGRDWILTRAAFRGQQVGVPLAQAYRIVQQVDLPY